MEAEKDKARSLFWGAGEAIAGGRAKSLEVSYKILRSTQKLQEEITIRQNEIAMWLGVKKEVDEQVRILEKAYGERPDIGIEPLSPDIVTEGAKPTDETV